jgi:predicted metal-dependent phosphoesterase TrpH
MNNSDFRADLHMHSFCSDGVNSPSELCHLAKAARLAGISITDHDTLQAYTPELFRLAEELNLQLLTGAEISSEVDGQSIHVLAYGVDASLQPFLDQVVVRREERNQRILEKLAKKGIRIEPSEIVSKGIVGRPHIAQAIVKKGAASSIQDAFNRYIKDTGPCYALGGKFTPFEVIEAIHRAKGKAVLAHPHFIKRGRLLRHLLSLSFDGLECYYGTLHKAQEAPWVKIAKEKGLIATGGSDYHGPLRPHSPLGCSWVGEETFCKLKN